MTSASTTPSLAGNRIRLLGKQPGSIVVELSVDAEGSLCFLSGSLLNHSGAPVKVKLPGWGPSSEDRKSFRRIYICSRDRLLNLILFC